MVFSFKQEDRPGRGSFMTTVYLGGGLPLSLFFFFLMCPAKKCFTREQEVKFFSSKWMAISHHLAPEGN